MARYVIKETKICGRDCYAAYKRSLFFFEEMVLGTTGLTIEESESLLRALVNKEKGRKVVSI